MNILVLGGGPSAEREVSLRSAAAVQDALHELGHDTVWGDPASASTAEIVELARGCDLTLPILHGEGGEDGDLQLSLEQADRYFLGSGSAACGLTYNKVIYKELLKKQQLPTPASEVVDARSFSASSLIHKPFIVKPITGGSSIDTFIVRQPPGDTVTIIAALKKYGTMLLEELIEGTEITVGVLGDTALPVIEIIPPASAEFDYENKYNGATQELCPAENVAPSIQKKAQQLALQVHQLTGCRHLSRTDFMINHAGELFILETNTLPGMTAQSLFPKAARHVGYSWNQLVAEFIQLASSEN